MRKGMNPQKQQSELEIDSTHRVIVVVYIPNDVEFYQESFEVFKLCLNSLIRSIKAHGKITIVNNGSNEGVSNFIYDYHRLKKIDTVIHHNINIGKIDALIGAARGAREKLITLADADVLFKQDWQLEVESVFHHFKNVGSVSPIAIRNAETYATSSGMQRILLKQLKFKFQSIPENFQDFNKYLRSINWDTEKDSNLMWPVVQSNGQKANLGSGHSVLTIDRTILFSHVPTFPSYILLGKNSVNTYIDDSINRSGKLRLSTYHNFAYHMGNTVEPWMKEILCENNTSIEEFVIRNPKNKNIIYKLKNKFYTLKRIVTKKIFIFFYKRG